MAETSQDAIVASNPDQIQAEKYAQAALDLIQQAPEGDEKLLERAHKEIDKARKLSSGESSIIKKAILEYEAEAKGAYLSTLCSKHVATLDDDDETSAEAALKYMDRRDLSDENILKASDIMLEYRMHTGHESEAGDVLTARLVKLPAGKAAFLTTWNNHAVQAFFKTF